MSTTHLAGPPVGFRKEDRWIQRCVVCGEKLEDLRPSRIAVIATPGVKRRLPQLAEWHLIRVTEGNPRRSEDLGDFQEAKSMPDDFCLALVEPGT